jgi:hypothetical protein
LAVILYLFSADINSCYDFLASIVGRQGYAQQLVQAINQLLAECGAMLNLAWNKDHFESTVTGTV